MNMLSEQEDNAKIIYGEREERNYEDPSRYAIIDRRIYSSESDKVKGFSWFSHDKYVLESG